MWICVDRLSGDSDVSSVPACAPGKHPKSLPAPTLSLLILDVAGINPSDNQLPPLDWAESSCFLALGAIPLIFSRRRRWMKGMGLLNSCIST